MAPPVRAVDVVGYEPTVKYCSSSGECRSACRRGAKMVGSQVTLPLFISHSRQSTSGAQGDGLPYRKNLHACATWHLEQFSALMLQSLFQGSA